MMGDKIQAKKIARIRFTSYKRLRRRCKRYQRSKRNFKKTGLPILIKAAGGGGGKGMIVRNENEFENLLTAKLEAKKYFGNDEVYIEKFLKIQTHRSSNFSREK